MPRSCTAGGFTLAELLVVTAILVVLASIVLPAVSLVRNAANAMRCLGNQKQVVLACFAYANDNRGALPALYLTKVPIATFWSHLILQEYLEAGRDADRTHTTFDRTALQGCSEWNRATTASTSPPRVWQGAYGMNGNPLCVEGVFNPTTSDWGNAPATARAITLSHITRPATRVFIGDALNADGTSTYRLNPTTGTVTESSNTTLLKSWHTAGRQVTVTMFDGHGEKMPVTRAAAGLIHPP
jgi:prepilin-type N-terminal cleavage/methylation domain-containing protein